MSDLGPDLPDDDALAAEHALGVLTTRERAAAEQRMARDPAFAADVLAWRARLAPLVEEVASVTPPSGLWLRIEKMLVVNDNVQGVRRRLRFWRAATLGSMAMTAASLAAVVFLAARPPEVITQPRQPMGPMMNARLMSDGGQPLFLAAYDPERKSILVASLVPPGADPDHSHELWLIPADGKPRSLGLIDPGASKTMPMSEPMADMTTEGVSLAVSVEPRGGSHQDRPSGPVAAVGKLARL
ncbi:anti-sigma-K factor RskA [Phenylobacterium haematophilum]|jgi:anti-sigma-K factor RskA|uniref:Regulator of SigK n=1 Tax=Phenylobacterium haematophilum TaxID=98513 RepID=A0A840A1P3_9CAUL|nr:anti-sigma factor [Phenylobacterium haematophilum]MBB3892224.1 anti-sigma-K factor RskA [Phenylobacterium haematophilum]